MNAIGLGDTTDAQTTVGVAVKNKQIVVKSFLLMSNKTTNLKNLFFSNPPKDTLEKLPL